MLRCRDEVAAMHEPGLPAVVISPMLVGAPEVSPTDVDSVSKELYSWIESVSM